MHLKFYTRQLREVTSVTTHEPSDVKVIRYVNMHECYPDVTRDTIIHNPFAYNLPQKFRNSS